MEIHLPEVPLAKIFSYLDGFSLLQAAQVSKSWNTVADREILWRRLCLRKWCFSDVTREHLCTQMWPHLGAQTWKQFFLRRTKQERCMERARPEDFIYREITGGLGEFTHVKYLSGHGLTMDGQGKSIICSVSNKHTLSTWDVQERFTLYKASVFNLLKPVFCSHSAPDAARDLFGIYFLDLLGIKIWSSPVQESIIINLDTIPEMQLAITLDIQRTIKVWNCRDRLALAALNVPQGCYTLKAFLKNNVPFLMVNDYVGHIYTFMLPTLLYLSKVKAFEYDIQLLHCSPENKWVFACKTHPHVFPKVYLTDCFLRPSEYSSPLYVCLPFTLCSGACWTPRRENRITVMCQRVVHKFMGFITFDLGLENIRGREIVTAQQIAKFLVSAPTNNPKFMGVSEANVIVFENGPSLLLYTIDGRQLHRFDDHQRDIRKLWVDPLHVLSTSDDGSLNVYMWEEGGRHLKSCCHLEHMKRRLPPPWLVYNICDNVSIVCVLSTAREASILQFYTLNMYTRQK